MYLEIAILPVLEGKESEFEAAFETARTGVFAKVAGCTGASLRRGVERPNDFVLLIEWATLEDHLDRFPQSSEAQVFRGLIGDLVAGPAESAHWQTVTN